MQLSDVGSEPVFDPAVCAVCGSRDADLIFEHRGRAFTSDGRTIDRDIKKLECRGCGAVRCGDRFDAAERERHYARDYQLAAQASRAEPLFYLSSGTVARSRAIADWLHRDVAAARTAPPTTLLEVGCGEGSVLRRVGDHWPHARRSGIDLGFTVATDGIEIRRGSYVEVTGPFDLIYSFAVIEHVASPRHFLAVLGAAVAPGGLLAAALPRLASGSRDLLFCDHLHHLHDDHVAHLAESAGLRERGASVGDGILGDFGLHVFDRAEPGRSRAALKQRPVTTEARRTIAAWRERWRALDAWLRGIGERRLLVWGLGESFGLFRTYSTLDGYEIGIGLDDNPSRFAGSGFSFPVKRLEDLSSADGEGSVVLLTFTPSSSVVARLRARGLSWFNAISGEHKPC